MAARKTSSVTPEEANPEDTVKILLRAQDSMERFDEQLEASRELSDGLRKELNITPLPRKAPRFPARFLSKNRRRM